MKITNADVQKILLEGKDIIFQEERSLHKFTELFKKLQQDEDTTKMNMVSS